MPMVDDCSQITSCVRFIAFSLAFLCLSPFTMSVGNKENTTAELRGIEDSVIKLGLTMDEFGNFDVDESCSDKISKFGFSDAEFRVLISALQSVHDQIEDFKDARAEKESKIKDKTEIVGKRKFDDVDDEESVKATEKRQEESRVADDYEILLIKNEKWWKLNDEMDKTSNEVAKIITATIERKCEMKKLQDAEMEALGMIKQYNKSMREMRDLQEEEVDKEDEKEFNKWQVKWNLQKQNDDKVKVASALNIGLSVNSDDLKLSTSLSKKHTDTNAKNIHLAKIELLSKIESGSKVVNGCLEKMNIKRRMIKWMENELSKSDSKSKNFEEIEKVLDFVNSF